MRFGINHTPSSGWFHSWLDFDADSVRRDLEGIAGLGADHVRIFPLWPLVQPNRTLIRRRALDDVACVVDVAAEFGLDVAVDALQGHLSSFDFLPSWLATWHRRNLFTDPDVVAAEGDYVRALARAVAGRPNLRAITLGNEVNQFAAPPHPSPHLVDARGGHAWLDSLVGAAREGIAEAGAAPVRDGGPIVVVAQYDAAWYDDAQPFGPEHASRHGDATVAHSWVFNGAARVDGPLGAPSLRHAEFLLRLAQASDDPGRRLWLQEVGAPTTVVPTSEVPDFLEGTVRHALDVPELDAVTWWCSHDVDRSLADFPEVEHDLGLLTADGRVKPAGERFAALAREAARSTGPDADGTSLALVVDDVDHEGRLLAGFRASCAPGGRTSLAWTRIAEAEEVGPAIVLRSRVADADALAARGIARLVEVPADQDSVRVASDHPAIV